MQITQLLQSTARVTPSVTLATALNLMALRTCTSLALLWTLREIWYTLSRSTETTPCQVGHGPPKSPHNPSNKCCQFFAATLQAIALQYVAVVDVRSLIAPFYKSKQKRPQPSHRYLRQRSWHTIRWTEIHSMSPSAFHANFGVFTRHKTTYEY